MAVLSFLTTTYLELILCTVNCLAVVPGTLIYMIVVLSRLSARLAIGWEGCCC